MNKLFILIILSLLFCNFTAAQSLRDELEKVKEIKLLESNRDDVRKIFAGYKFENNNISEYSEWFNTNDIEVEFSYSEGKCRNEDSDGLNVAEWRVDHINISLKNQIKLKDFEIYLKIFGLKLSKFNKEKMYINQNDFYMYHNKDLGMGLKFNKDRLEKIIFIPPKKYYSMICNMQIRKRLTSTNSFFIVPLKYRKLIIRSVDTISEVLDLSLSQVSIMTDCPLIDSNKIKVCFNNSKVIDVFTNTNTNDTDDILTYKYSVSAGKIIGKGANVKWDLSDVKPGTYTITAAVDDGCGFCGKTMTKTVTVKECPDCKEK